MLSIFENKEFEEQPDRKQALNRLQTVLGPAPLKPAAVRPASGLDKPPAANRAAVSAVVMEKPPIPNPPTPAAAVTLERRPLPPPAPAAPQPPPAESPDPSVPAGLQQFADQFARGFRELLVSTVRDLQAPMVEERRKMQSAFDSLGQTAKDLDTLMSELAEATDQINLLAKSVEELAARAGKLEDTANIVNAAAHALQDAQQATEKRLEVQAGVIRDLNHAVKGREDRLDKVLSMFQALQGGANENSGRRSLPDNL